MFFPGELFSGQEMSSSIYLCVISEHSHIAWPTHSSTYHSTTSSLCSARWKSPAGTVHMCP